MFCSKCGEKNAEGSNFCTSCGNSLKQESNYTDSSQRQPRQNELVSSPEFYNYVSVALIILAILNTNLAFFTCVGAVITALIGRKKTQNKKLNTAIIIIAIALVFILIAMELGQTPY